MGTLLYLKNLVKDRHVASVMPTSNYAVKRICKAINFLSADIIVEYGPGTGVFTKYLLSKMTAHSRLIAVEQNKALSIAVRARLSDRRLTVINESAEQIEKIMRDLNIEAADYVISGIPFTLISANSKLQIVRATNALLRPQGKFLVYQTFPQPTRQGKSIRDYLATEMTVVQSSIILRNIPPLINYVAEKKIAAA